MCRSRSPPPRVAPQPTLAALPQSIPSDAQLPTTSFLTPAAHPAQESRQIPDSQTPGALLHSQPPRLPPSNPKLPTIDSALPSVFESSDPIATPFDSANIPMLLACLLCHPAPAAESRLPPRAQKIPAVVQSVP